LGPSPITQVFVTKVFSPTCECETDLGVIAFRLRRAERLTLSIADRGRHTVRTLVGPVARRRGPFSATWDGRDEDGAVVPDGVYRPLVHLRHRTILMPNRIRIDTTPPRVRLRSVAPRVLEPGKRLRVRYLLDEPARVYVFLDGKRVVLGRSTRPRWKVEWHARGRPGVYRMTTAATPDSRVDQRGARVAVRVARGFGSGVSSGSTRSRRCSKSGGSDSRSPRCSASSSTAKPGPSVAISNSTPLGSRK